MGLVGEVMLTSSLSILRLGSLRGETALVKEGYLMLPILGMIEFLLL
jgi:hypothetical protein